MARRWSGQWFAILISWLKIRPSSHFERYQDDLTHWKLLNFWKRRNFFFDVQQQKFRQLFSWCCWLSRCYKMRRISLIAIMVTWALFENFWLICFDLNDFLKYGGNEQERVKKRIDIDYKRDKSNLFKYIWLKIHGCINILGASYKINSINTGLDHF